MKGVKQSIKVYQMKIRLLLASALLSIYMAYSDAICHSLIILYLLIYLKQVKIAQTRN